MMASLAVKSKDSKLDVIFRSRIVAMVGTLNLYLDPQLTFTWQQASVLVAKSNGKSAKFARIICEWLHTYLRHNTLPMHCYSRYHLSILKDEDISQAIQLKLLQKAKGGFINGQDVVDIVGSPEVQELLGTKHGAKICSISLRTAQCWIKKLDWRYGQPKKGMYIDGHEHEHAIAYRKEFLTQWKEYEKHMVTYDNDGNIATSPRGFPVENGRFQLILVTHNESTFYANDRRRLKWTHISEKAAPK